MTDTAEPQTQPSQQNAQAQQPQQSSQQSKHMMTPREKKWIVYDVGNSAFVLLSTAVVPIYANSLLKAAGETNIVSTWGYAQTIASLVIAVLMPLLGSIADVQGMKIRFFTGFFLTGVVMCCAMAMPLGWLAFIIVYVLATIGLNGSLTFYDSMLVDTTSNERMDRISSHGYAWGYIGSTVPFIVCIALIFGGPALFGWSTTACTRASFVITALWWVAFTIPLIRNVRQVHYKERTAHVFSDMFRGIGRTIKAIVHDRRLLLFMVAFFFYIDGVHTVIKMSTSYGTDLGIDSTQLVLALLVTQFVAFPSAIAYGRLSERFGTKRMLLIAIFAYFCIVLFAAFFLRSALEFWILAICVGLFQGGIQALSRSEFGKLIPKDNANEYYGFFDIFGKYAAVMGTFLVSVFTQLTGNPSIGVLSIAVLFLVGFVLLVRMPEKE